jgi:hypothetical protein
MQESEELGEKWNNRHELASVLNEVKFVREP